ncbi:MAG: hypothetical protein ABJB74_06760 [Gemmatimonas sp.]
MFRYRSILGTGVTTALVTVLIMAACTATDEFEDQDICKTTVTAATSPVTGALTLSGMFYANETVILSYSENGVTKQVQGTPATDRTAFTLTGLPSGDQSVTVIISCDAGRENNGSRTYTVK